jgi:hypothetical protein
MSLVRRVEVSFNDECIAKVKFFFVDEEARLTLEGKYVYGADPSHYVTMAADLQTLEICEEYAEGGNIVTEISPQSYTLTNEDGDRNPYGTGCFSIEDGALKWKDKRVYMKDGLECSECVLNEEADLEECKTEAFMLRAGKNEYIRGAITFTNEDGVLQGIRFITSFGCFWSFGNQEGCEAALHGEADSGALKEMTFEDEIAFEFDPSVLEIYQKRRMRRIVAFIVNSETGEDDDDKKRCAFSPVPFHGRSLS